jgi:hypothetical protein
MYKQLMISFLLLSISAFSQETLNFNQVDSISYALFQNEKWDELIKTGKEATSHQINFKRLQQRIGYAYFAKADYYNAIKHYEKSLEFDQNDEISHLYLYFAGLNIGDEAFARFHAAKLSNEIKKENQLVALRPIDAIDFEYNKKMNDYTYRSNPDFIRLGLNTRIGYRLNLYQSVSRFNQISQYEAGTINEYSASTVQNEYFALLSWSILSKTFLSAGYHHVNSKVDYGLSNAEYPGRIWLGQLKQKIHRFSIGLSGSVYDNDSIQATQIGIQIGAVLPGKCSPYLKSAVYNLNESNVNRIIFSQTAGLFVLPSVWAEATVTLGNLNNYVNMNGLYFYNSPDATTFRSGLSLFWYQSKHLTFYSNYTYDKKEVYQSTNTYNQHSITGGIIWKL